MPPEINDRARDATPITTATLAPGAKPLIFDVREVVLRMLPEASQAKLIELREARDDQHAKLMPITDDVSEKREVELKLRSRINQLKGDFKVRQEGMDHPSLVDAERQLSKVTGEIARLNKRHAILSEGFQARGRLVAWLESYLLKLAREQVDVTPHIVGAMKLSSAEPSRVAVDRVRKQIADACADLHTVMSAPIKSDAAKEIARAYFNALADRGSPNWDRLLAHGGSVEWPEVRTQISVRGEGTSVGSIVEPDYLASQAWINREAMIAKAEREIDEIADDTQALTDAERVKKSAKLRAEILGLERQEEMLITIASEHGDGIIRRVDADPRAVLLLSSDMPRAVNEFNPRA